MSWSWLVWWYIQHPRLQCILGHLEKVALKWPDMILAMSKGYMKNNVPVQLTAALLSKSPLSSWAIVELAAPNVIKAMAMKDVVFFNMVILVSGWIGVVRTWWLLFRTFIPIHRGGGKYEANAGIMFHLWFDLHFGLFARLGNKEAICGISLPVGDIFSYNYLLGQASWHSKWVNGQYCVISSS